MMQRYIFCIDVANTVFILTILFNLYLHYN
nr:MAG TPA: hypothetical protein [Caudoviricetes sp.]